MQLYPQEEFVIARGLEDHTDASTYYVQAKIRNAKTDVIIPVDGNAFLNLTDQGDSHRFSKKWQVPADPTGLGFWILITTSVYTDSGYTTKSQNYGDKYEEYFIEARLNHGGGGGVDVDYKKVRQIVQEELATLPPPTPPAEPVDLKPVLSSISGLRAAIEAIELPEAKETDLAPVMAKIEAVGKAVAALEMPDAPDFSGIEFRLDKIENALEHAEAAALSAELKDLTARCVSSLATTSMKSKLRCRSSLSASNASLISRCKQLTKMTNETPTPTVSPLVHTHPAFNWPG